MTNSHLNGVLDNDVLDFHVADHGSILVVTPLTEEAKQWTDEHITDDEVQWWGQGFAVEPRYIEPIVYGIVADGLEIGHD